MKRKLVSVLMVVAMTAMLFGCGKKAAEPSRDAQTIKAGTLTLLNASEEDYAKMQDRSLSLIESIEAGQVKEGKLNADRSEEDANAKKTQFTYYDSLDSMIMALDAGEIEAVQLYSSVGKYVCANNKSLELKDLYDEATRDETKDAIESIFSDSFSFMLAEGKTELRAELDKAIMEMQKDGTMDKLVKEHIDGVINGKEPSAITMETIKGADTIKVGVTGDLPPLDYISTDGTPGGFNTAVLAEIGKRIGKNIELVNIYSGSRAIALSSGNVDAVFWTRGSVEGIAPEGEPGEDAPKGEGEDPEGLRQQPEDLPELPEDDAMSKDLDEYKKRDMPEGTIVTIPYYTDHYVMVYKK